MRRLKAGHFVARPHAVVLLLLAANIVQYFLCLYAGGRAVIPLPLLAARGALLQGALQPGEWWRLAAAGFLHADPVHLLMNMYSLLAIGPFLERRVGPSTFALIYGVTLIGGSIISLGLHNTPFIGVGASGAIFGIIGALFALWMLGATEISPQFFLINFGLNIAFASRGSRVDWAAHLGGFVAGLLAVAVLDLMVRTNRFWLVCSVPEFVKGNLVLLLAVGCACAALGWPKLAGSPALPFIAAASGPAALAGIKLLDVLLAARRGLVPVVLLLAAANGASVATLVALAPSVVAVPCSAAAGLVANLNSLTSLCGPAFAGPLAGLCAVLLTLAAYTGPLRRGAHDVGFVGAGLKAERQRERSLVSRPAASRAR